MADSTQNLQTQARDGQQPPQEPDPGTKDPIIYDLTAPELPDPGTKDPASYDLQPPQEPDPGTKDPIIYDLQG